MLKEWKEEEDQKRSGECNRELFVVGECKQRRCGRSIFVEVED